MPVRPRTALITLLAAAAGLAGAADAQAAFPGRNGLMGYAATANGRLYVRDSHGALRRVRTPGPPRDPAFSPEGLRVAYGTADGRLWTSYLDGKPLPLGTHVTPSRNPAWSPAGDRIAFAGGRDGRRDLYTIGAYGRGRTQLTFNPADDYAPAWSSFGVIAFVRSTRRTHGDILTMPGAGGRARRVTRGRADDESPAWSPNGRWIAFTRSAKSGRQLYVVRADGRRLRRLTRLKRGVSSPAWSPSGRWIVFVSGRPRHHRLYAVRTNGRRLQRSGGWGDPSAVDWQATGADPVVAAAGDIACDPLDPAFNQGRGTDAFCHMRQTSDLLLERDLSGVLELGDAQYEDNQYWKFLRSFDPTWGRVKNLIHPTVGNHEVRTPGASGYYDYYDGIGRQDGPAGPRGVGYYSLDIGTWHIISLNSECGNPAKGPSRCAPGSAQDQWLRADLAAHPARCTLAFFHKPLVSSGIKAVNTAVTPLWQELYDAGADVVLNGHDHAYERFAPMTPTMAPDPLRGLREFVVGTGGKDLQAAGPLQPNSELRRTVYGVLELTLHPTSYDWQFVREGGQVQDSGHQDCH
ncbi:MAG TPA: metallophosphoesterase [Solirubrobacteraceae bacterium]